MLPAPDDGDKTILRPAFGLPASRTSSAVDSRQIGALAAINPIVAAANPLLMTISLIRSGDAPADVDALRTQLVDWIKEFDAACGRAGIPEDQQHLARYALCTVLDEMIQVEARQRTAWSHVANWAQHSLLLHCFGGNWGGKEFFLILDKLVQAPARYMWLLQLFYICLSLGFMGQFRMSEQQAAGQQQIADLRERLYQQVIRPAAPEPDRALSIRWRGLAVAARQFQGFTALWLTAGGALLFCVLLFMAYALKLDSIEDELHLGRLELAKTTPKAAPAAAGAPAASEIGRAHV